MVGRHSTFSPEIADTICEQLAEGHSLRRICATKDLPHIATVFRWLEQNAAFREQYARARELQADTLADEILDIADDGRNDKTVDENGIEVIDHDVIARSRLRVDARKWIASKLKPKVYSERSMTTIDATMTTTVRMITDAELLNIASGGGARITFEAESPDEPDGMD
jgi:hypothetical protein